MKLSEKEVGRLAPDIEEERFVSETIVLDLGRSKIYYLPVDQLDNSVAVPLEHLEYRKYGYIDRVA